MKPSEYVKRYLHYPILNQKDFLKLIKSYDNNLDNIDKIFINKEELKDKIKEILDESLTKACLRAMEDKDFIKIYDKNLRKILELLK